MEYTRLGQTGLAVSRICFGCAAIGGYDYGPVEDAISIGAIHKALDLGINFFDVADVYGFGHAESTLQKALGARVNQLVIATKFGVRWSAEGETMRDISPAHLRRALEGSLRRLGCDSITLYQVHWPDHQTSLEDAVATLAECQQAGKIRHFGVCNLTGEDVRSCQKIARLESLQIPFSLAERQNTGLIQIAAREHFMTVMVYNALAHGLFSGKYNRESVFSGTDLRARVKLFQGEAFENALELLDRIRQVASTTGKTCTQVALNWTLSQCGVSSVIVGTKSASQIEDSVAAIEFRLDAEQLKQLSA